MQARQRQPYPASARSVTQAPMLTRSARDPAARKQHLADTQLAVNGQPGSPAHAQPIP
jgi:hypothetical protein